MGIISRVRRRYKEETGAMRQKAAGKSLIRKKARAEYLRAREGEELKYARFKAKHQREKKEKRLKSGGITGQLIRGFAETGRHITGKPPKIRKVVKTKKTSGYVVIGGKAYPKAMTGKRKKKKKKTTKTSDSFYPDFDLGF